METSNLNEHKGEKSTDEYENLELKKFRAEDFNNIKFFVTNVTQILSIKTSLENLRQLLITVNDDEKHPLYGFAPLVSRTYNSLMNDLDVLESYQKAVEIFFDWETLQDWRSKTAEEHNEMFLNLAKKIRG